MTIQDWLGKDNTLGIDIWEHKYRHSDESFDAWLDRVSANNDDVNRLIAEKKFIFGGRILANRGIDDEKLSLSNCYVIAPPEDNLESIFDTAKKLARTYSYGGGCGTDLSKLAPKGAKVRNAAKESSGSVSFMDLYSLVTGLISQNGRRGALMLSMSCEHPDIEEFIDIKTDLDRVTKANISVRMTNAFMKAVETDADFTLTFKREETCEVIEKKVRARDIMRKLAHNNWDMGEPGVLFWDNIENHNFLNAYPNFEYAGTNPCAEEPLPSGGSCLLGAINLSEFVKQREFDYESFISAVDIAVRALNDVLDEGLPKHPLDEQRESVKNWRQIGLGIMGLADMLIKMGIDYGSMKAVDVSTKIACFMLNAAAETSCRLAKEHGAFPMYEYQYTAQSSMFDLLTDITQREIEKFGMRNSQLLTIAPTGTLSTMLGISGGIEPIFETSYTRRTQSLFGEDVFYKVYTPIVEQYMKENNITDERYLPSYFITSADIDYKDRIAMQAAWQKCIDASISSTVNLPEDTTEDEVMDLYMTAWKAGLKGITVFRNNCRRAAVLFTAPKEEPADDTPALKRGEIAPASDNLVGKKRKIMSGCGSLHCEAFFDPHTGGLMETYLSKGSTGGCNSFMIGLSRMISLSARAGVDIHHIVDQLFSTPVCPSYAVRSALKHDVSKGACCPTAVGHALMDMYNEMQNELKSHTHDAPCEKHAQPARDESLSMSVCPECGEKTTREGGCIQCKNCGWSKCD